MRTKFRIGERVRIRCHVSPYPGKVGTVVGLVRVKRGISYDVMLDLMSQASVPHPKQYMADELDSVER